MYKSTDAGMTWTHIGLPEAGQQEFAAWLTELKNRQAVLDAVAALAATMSQN